MNRPNSIYDFIQSEETNYKLPIQVIDNWDWSMLAHISTTILYKNSTYISGKDENRPFKNIIRPILNLQYRAEGFDVKDIELFVDEPKNYYKSFLVRKYHDKWARENGIDTFIDDLVESYVDYGGTLVKKINKSVPEVIPMQSITFCDQTDILSGPICIKHFYSSDQLKEMESAGWGDKSNGANISIDDLITLANREQDKVKDKVQGRTSHTPGKHIGVHEVHGIMPRKFLGEDAKDTDFVNQIQIVAFYTAENQTKGCTLFAKEEKTSPFKLILRDKIFGRALGLGGAEELFEPQVWINYAKIKEKDMLDSAAKTLLQTDDSSFANRNKLNNLDNNEILVVEEGKKITQIDTYPRNIALFDKSVSEWEAHAQQMGSAQDAIMGEQPKSGTPFALQQLVAAESHSLHEYRKGKLATFVDEIYQDWIIPYISKELTKEQEFVAVLDLEEMQDIKERVATKQANDFIKKQILSGSMINSEDVEMLKEKTKEEFTKGGNKRFLKILAKELEDAPISVRINVANKQKNMPAMIEKLSSVFRQVTSNPQILQVPPFAKLFNSIIEASGLSPIDFSGFTNPLPQQGRIQPSIPQQEMTV